MADEIRKFIQENSTRSEDVGYIGCLITEEKSLGQNDPPRLCAPGYLTISARQARTMETLELGYLLSKDMVGFFTSVLELRLAQSDKTDLVAFLRVL